MPNANAYFYLLVLNFMFLNCKPPWLTNEDEYIRCIVIVILVGVVTSYVQYLPLFHCINVYPLCRQFVFSKEPDG